MADVFSKEKRSWLMSKVRGVDTTPEKTVRSFLHQRGFRFRLHVSKLPGKPDIVLARHNTVIFVHGCFWHGHPACRKATLPQTRPEFWENKIKGNIRRDRKWYRMLKSMGWNVLTLWECQVRKPSMLERRLLTLLNGR
jgi:DNA mismatch endonuclease (patch repair protein)